MNKYYAHINLLDNSIGKGQCPCSGENIVCLEITQEVYDNIEKYIYVDGELVLDPDYEEKQRKKEEERIAQLTMTALDFITFLQQMGLTLEQINAYLDSNLSVKMQLTYCQNVYCGVACALMPITLGDITITKEDVIMAFRIKNGEIIDENTSTTTDSTDNTEEELEL